MVFSYLVFVVFFIGGMWLLGIAHELPAFQGVVFVAGILSICLAMAYIMRASGTETRRGMPAERVGGESQRR